MEPQQPPSYFEIPESINNELSDVIEFTPSRQNGRTVAPRDRLRGFTVLGSQSSLNADASGQPEDIGRGPEEKHPQDTQTESLTRTERTDVPAVFRFRHRLKKLYSAVCHKCSALSKKGPFKRKNSDGHNLLLHRELSGSVNLQNGNGTHVPVHYRRSRTLVDLIDHEIIQSQMDTAPCTSPTMSNY